MTQFALPDGRTLAYEVIGDPSDPVVVSIHGTPGSRLASHPAVDGVCVVSFDRPGYGGSSPQPGRTIASVSHDVAALADRLDVETFTVYGISGGGPHALACAALLPDRVTGVASLVGIAPASTMGREWTTGMTESNIAEFEAAYAGRDALADMLIPAAQQVREDPEALADMLAEELPPPDLAALADPVIRASLVGTIVEGLRVGADGWIDDDLAFVAPWGFDVSTITVPALIWHGEDDELVPVGHAYALHALMPHARLITVPNAGHLASFAHAAQVIGWLAHQDPI